MLDDIKKVVSRCRTTLDLENANLGNEYGYKSLPLCVIDALWSIGVRYGGVQNVISRYSEYFGLKGNATDERHTISHLLSAMDSQGVLQFSEEVFRNAQRTSPRNGILKAEAVYLFAGILYKHGIETIADVPKIGWYEDLPREMDKPYASEILSIPGQRSGISLTYFYMLTGSTGLVKADRMVTGFLYDALDWDVTAVEAQYFISHASKTLQADFPLLTPRMLDHEIWKYQRGGSKA